MYPTTTLQPGSTNTVAVKQLQDFLVSQRMMTRSQVDTGYGIYGAQTTEAVKKWQEANGVDNSSGPGYWGPKSIAAAQGTSTSMSTPTSTSSTQPVEKTTYDPSWSITPWQMGPGGWQNQPVLTIDGQQYRFNTPQEYVNAMSGLSNVSKYIGQFNNALPYWDSVKNTSTTTPTPPPVTQTAYSAPTLYGPNGQIATPTSSTTKAQIDAAISSGWSTTPPTATSTPVTQTPVTQTPVTQTPATQTTYTPPTLYSPDGQVATPAPGTTKEQIDNAIASGWSTTSPAGITSPSSSNSPVSTSYYGSDDRNKKLEQDSLTEVRFIENAAKSSGLIDSNFLSNLITSKPEMVAFYVNALTYGGYNTGDVLNDIKRREMIYNNDPKAKNMPAIINPDLKRTEYLATPEGQRSVTEAAAIIPTFNLQGIMDPEILKYGANMPDDVFKMLVPLLNKDSQEFKDAVANVKSAYFDIADQKLRATNEQEKAVADYNEKNFKEQINKQYGILLSDDAATAWKQLETLGDTFNTRGIAGSGMQNEEVDNYLKTVRKQDSRYRDEKLTKEEVDKASYYRTSASEDEIAALTPEERAKWGLTPSADLAEKYSIASLKARFPNSTEEELQSMRDATIDKNGNFRSAIYSKYYTSMNVNYTNRKDSAKTEVIAGALDKEAAAYKQYDYATNVLNIKGGQGTANQTGSQTSGQTGSQTSSQTSGQTGSQTSGQTSLPVSNSYYNVVSGDNLSTIASRNNITTAQLIALNPQITNPNLINVGQQINLPKTATGATTKMADPIKTININTGSTPSYIPPKEPTLAPPKTPDKPINTIGINTGSTTKSPYKVISGDTLSSIAARNNTTVADLAKKNNITNPNLISIGQTLNF